jgi:tetratricopeptide (TPR) repeat protein
MLFRAAVAHHQAGRLAQAEAAYRQLLAGEPDHADALHLLAVLLHQSRRSTEAEPLVRRAAALAPRNAEIHNTLGSLLRDTGRPAAATDAFRAALRAQPNTPEIRYNLGLALLDAGDLPAAEAALRNAARLKPDFVAARLDLANLLIRLNRPAEAEASARAALRHEPANPRLHNALGLSLAAQHNPTDALAAFDAAIAHTQGFYLEAHANRAGALIALDRPTQAEAAYRAILATAPADAPTLRALIDLLRRQDRAAETEPFLRTLLTGQPDDPDLHAYLGAALAGLDRRQEAIAAFDASLALRPGDAGTLHARSIMAFDLARFDDSLTDLQHAASAAPEDPAIRTSLAHAHLLRADYATGWPLFEARLRLPDATHLDAPAWDGRPTDRVVLVHAEQGIGDTLQFCRFLPNAAARAPIVFLGPTSCARLFQSFSTLQAVCTDLSVPPYDLQCALMSLPGLLDISEAEFAVSLPYLHVDPAGAAAWRQRLGVLPGLRVGLVWGGNPKFGADRRRSLPLSAFAELLALPGVTFVSLQKGEIAAAEIAALNLPDLIDIAPDLHDFADTAAALTALDLLITVDTAVAHLAGALLRPVWMLNRADTDWRWQLSRTDSPWYPTLRLFRQATPGHWQPVLEALRNALASRIAVAASG